MKILFEHAKGYGRVDIKDNHVVWAIVQNDMLLNSLLIKLRKGIPKAADRDYEGYETEKMEFEPIEDNEQILEFLQSLDEGFNIHNIRTFNDMRESTCKEAHDARDISIYKRKKYAEFNRGFREFPNRYEYCLVKEYEAQFEDNEFFSISLEDIFAQMIILEGRVLLVAIEFSKDRFTLKKVISWLDQYNVMILNNSGSNSIEKAEKIIDALKFKGIPIVLYEKGKKTIMFDRNQLPEIMESYTPAEQIVDFSQGSIIE